jgi:hypothetical protein
MGRFAIAVPRTHRCDTSSGNCASAPRCFGGDPGCTCTWGQTLFFVSWRSGYSMALIYTDHKQTTRSDPKTLGRPVVVGPLFPEGLQQVPVLGG